MANLRLQPKTACSRLPPVERVDLTGQERVDLRFDPVAEPLASDGYLAELPSRADMSRIIVSPFSWDAAIIILAVINNRCKLLFRLGS